MSGAARKRWSPKRTVKTVIRPIVKPWTTGSRVANAASELGVTTGNTLLVHSSLQALGFVPGGPKAIIRALLALIGREGTLVMPTHTWEWMDRGERRFDVAKTPSCLGAITETFRQMPGVIRSLHPTHSVAACGAASEELLCGHEQAGTPCGPGTPYAKLLERGAGILFIGVGLNYNTCFYTAEMAAEVPYVLSDVIEQYTVIDQVGAARHVQTRRHRRGVRRRFAEMEGWLVDRRVLIQPRDKAVPIKLIHGRQFLRQVSDALRADPALLLAEPRQVMGSRFEANNAGIQ